MITQVRNYARDCYLSKDGSNLSRNRVNTKQCMFYGYIIASKEDIEKEVDENGHCNKIPFLEYSYYTMPTIPEINEKDKKIHIDLLSFTDIKTLAERRHKAFFRFLNP